MAIDLQHSNDTIISTIGTLTIQPIVNVTASIITQNVSSNVVNSSVTNIQVQPANTNYILSMRDSGQTIVFTNSSTTLVNVNNTLPVGFRCVLVQGGTGNVQIQSGANVTINPVTGFRQQIALQWGSASLLSWNANTFILDGALS